MPFPLPACPPIKPRALYAVTITPRLTTGNPWEASRFLLVGAEVIPFLGGIPELQSIAVAAWYETFNESYLAETPTARATIAEVAPMGLAEKMFVTP